VVAGRGERREPQHLRERWHFFRHFLRDAHPAYTPEEIDRYVQAWSQPGAATGMINYYRSSVRTPPKQRITPELERSHDLVCHIASRAGQIPGAELSPRCRELVERMDEVACRMWRQAADCWCQRDGFTAPALDEVDDELDKVHASLMAELASGTMALPATMEMTLVARFYERLGDHAVNIARRVIYLAGSTHARPLSVSG
jgi:phosphate uptake regulator